MSVRAELEALVSRDGALTPESVLSAARDPRSELHARFDWDNKSAGEKYRLVQAGALIRQFKIEVITSPQEVVKVRAFVNVPKPDDEGTHYVPVADALSDHRRDDVIKRAIRELTSFRRKYERLIDVDAVIQAEQAQAAQQRVPA